MSSPLLLSVSRTLAFPRPPVLQSVRTLKVAPGKKKGADDGKKGAAEGAAGAGTPPPPYPYPKPVVNYGSMAGYFSKEELGDGESSSTSREKERYTPSLRVLRADSVLGFRGNKSCEVVTREHGYTDRELSALSDSERLQAVDFLHLTMPVIEEQTDRIRPLCTPFTPPSKQHILRFVTRQVLDGKDKPHPLNLKMTLKVSLKDLGLSEGARAKLLTLVKSRYHADTDELVLNSARFPTAAANKVYLVQQLTQLLEEAKKN